MANKQVRCAVYTRKSSEEGLEQSFNSLHAQREACCAFIQSQKHEGWTLVGDHYDDGGFSGGTMERPALRQLLSDIQEHKIDTLVVYKVDRLTRSLMDFSKMIEVFDAHGVSFVSVTQQFNTTTSMGRLTLNVLLSFAQFEREVTGERIRDKIAASKRKGMWMGGAVPLGYDRINHRLVVNQAEAEAVREIFRQYLRLGCVSKLRDHLAQHQISGKLRTNVQGQTSGGVPYGRGALYHLLRNRLYVGEIVHGSRYYPGQHEPILSRELWDRVAAQLAANSQARRQGKSVSTPSLLSGILFDPQGVRFTPTHAVKNGRRYRYYTSQAAIQHADQRPKPARIPAQELETLILSQIAGQLASPEQCLTDLDGPEKEIAAARAAHLAKRWPELETSEQHEFLRKIVRRVVIGSATAWIDIDRRKLLERLLDHEPEFQPAAGKQHILKLSAAFQSLHRGRQIHLVPPNGPSSEGTPVPSLIHAVARAYLWYERIMAGEVETIRDLARGAGVTTAYVTRILQLAFLSPKIVEIVLSGKHRSDLVLAHLLKLPVDWPTQNHMVSRG
jgi:site-specific DNA recombinase